MRKSTFGALTGAALLTSLPAYAAPDPYENGATAIAAGTEPHVFTVGKPVWSITANGKANLAVLSINNATNVDFRTGLVLLHSEKTDFESSSISVDIVALAPGKTHALICRTKVFDSTQALQFRTIIETVNGESVGQAKSIKPVKVADGSFSIATYTFSLGTSPTAKVDIRVPASANPTGWSFRNCYVALASF